MHERDNALDNLRSKMAQTATIADKSLPFAPIPPIQVNHRSKTLTVDKIPRHRPGCFCSIFYAWFSQENMLLYVIVVLMAHLLSPLFDPSVVQDVRVILGFLPVLALVAVTMIVGREQEKLEAQRKSR